MTEPETSGRYKVWRRSLMGGMTEVRGGEKKRRQKRSKVGVGESW